MRWLWLAAAVAVGWILLRPGEPAWYRDLMLRGFAADQVPDPNSAIGVWSAVAVELDLPVRWVQQIAKAVPVEQIAAAAHKVRDAVLAMGPPANTLPETLAAYKTAALAAGGVR